MQLTRIQTTVACLFWSLTLLITIWGCTTAYTVHPGSINTFDSQAADDLLLVQTTLCGANSTPTTCPGGLTAEVKAHPFLLKPVQTATRSYNTAEALYEAWVASVKAASGTPTKAPANVQQAIQQAKTDTASAQRTATTGGGK